MCLEPNVVLRQLSKREREGFWCAVSQAESWLGSWALRDRGQAGLTPTLPPTAPAHRPSSSLGPTAIAVGGKSSNTG